MSSFVFLRIDTQLLDHDDRLRYAIKIGGGIEMSPKETTKTGAFLRRTNVKAQKFDGHIN